MKLIASFTSPYARKVRIVLAEKKIDCPLEVEDPWETDSNVSQYNPVGKVPVLELDDGTTLYDSRVIVEYLDNISPVSRLFPEGNRQSILVRRWEALSDGVIDAAVSIVQERARALHLQDCQWISRQQRKIDSGIAALARDLGERPWCYGESYSLADIATGCCLGYLVTRFPDLGWQTRYPNLKTLHDKLEARSSFIDTKPPAP